MTFFVTSSTFFIKENDYTYEIREHHGDGVSGCTTNQYSRKHSVVQVVKMGKAQLTLIFPSKTINLFESSSCLVVVLSISPPVCVYLYAAPAPTSEAFLHAFLLILDFHSQINWV